MPQGYHLFGVWGSSGSDVYVVGMHASERTASILHYNGSSWSSLARPLVSGLYGIVIPGNGEVLIGGESGAIMSTTDVIPAGGGEEEDASSRPRPTAVRWPRRCRSCGRSGTSIS